MKAVVTNVVVVVALVIVAAASAAAQPTRATTLHRVAVSSSQAGVVSVTIAASGPIPRPRVGVLQDPARIFLDFSNVGIGRVPREIKSADAPVSRVRVGTHLSPAFTRVVIDLATSQPYGLELAPNFVRVTIGQASPVVPAMITTPAPPDPMRALAPKGPPDTGAARPWADIAPVPALPPQPGTPERTTVAAPDPVKPPAPTPTAPPAPTYAPLGPTPAPGDLDRYRKQAWGALDRLRLQQPLLMSLDAGQPQTADRIQMAVAEFERLRQDFVAFKPPESVTPYHAALVQSSTLGLMAFTLRLDAFRTSDASTIRNASSAAAGAVLLIERACAVLNCPPIPGK